MLCSITVKNRQDQEISLGIVTHVELSQPIAANFGQAQAEALELGFYRDVGQNLDDPADDVFFEHQAGQNHQGQVEAFETRVSFKNPKTQAEIGELTLHGAVQSYCESDLGAAIRAHIVLRATSYEYRPTNGPGVIHENAKKTNNPN